MNLVVLMNPGCVEGHVPEDYLVALNTLAMPVLLIRHV